MVKPAIAKPKDLRQYAVIPILATRDPRLKPPVLKTLVALCAYADRMGRTFVSLDRIAADLGCSPSGVSKHMTTLKRLGYVTNAKPLHRAQRSKSRRIIYTPRPMTEDAIRSSLRPAEQMEVAEQEAQMLAQMKGSGTSITTAEQGREALKARFVMLCEQYFRDARAAGWWISDIQARRAALALAEQAAGCVRLDRNAAEAPSEALGYLESPDDEPGL
jgi:biotin operon repressor